jgi:hypothetical protein
VVTGGEPGAPEQGACLYNVGVAVRPQSLQLISSQLRIVVFIITFLA